MNKYHEIVKAIKEQLTGDYADNICNYNSGYICDVISEIADYNVDIYTNDLLDWLKNNYEWFEEAIEQFGEPKDSRGKFNMIIAIQQGQFMQIEHSLYDDFEEMIKLYAYNYLRENDIDFNEKQIYELENYLYNIDSNDMLEQINDKIEEIKN